MANNSNPNRTSLAGRVAAEKRQAAETKQLKTRVASAWTLAKTMLPGAPADKQLKVAQNLLLNPTTVLHGMLRQAAVNIQYTRIAEEFKNVHKVELNDLLEDPSILRKEEKAVISELKGEAKDASLKDAAQDKGTGPQPETYDEGKRSEPKELDASRAGDRPKEPAESKEAGKKIACEDGCKGSKDCDHGKDNKEASRKTAEEGVDEEATGEGGAEPNPVEESAEEHAENADGDAEEGAADAEVGDTEGAAEAEGEVFDEETATLQDAIEDVKHDIDVLDDAISEEIGDADEIALPELSEIPPPDGMFGEEGAEGGEGEELDMDGIFGDDNMSDKVSSFKDEGAELDDTEGDIFFEPSDAGDLEGLLDQEEKVFSPADMFQMDGVDDDPLAALFGGPKTAADSEIVQPGDLVDEFETSLKGDDRNAETDHDQDIFGEVLESLKQPEATQDRTKQDQEPDLKDPAHQAALASEARRNKRVNKGASAQTGFPKLAAHFDPMQVNKIAGGNLASLLFTDESDFI